MTQPEPTRGAEGAGMEWWYWPVLAFNDVRWFGKRRRWGALARSLWRIFHADNGERCGICGRDYVLWMANDGLYLGVVGSLGGQWCPTCFSAEAERKGSTLIWEPHHLGVGGRAMNEAAERIGAFQ